jgi:hypothetical protein
MSHYFYPNVTAVLLGRIGARAGGRGPAFWVGLKLRNGAQWKADLKVACGEDLGHQEQESQERVERRNLFGVGLGSHQGGLEAAGQVAGWDWWPG